MRTGAALFTAALAITWAVLLYVSVHAVAAMGMNAAGAVFFGDFAHPWRAQFNADFAIHLLMVAAWMIWRAPSRIAGMLCALLAVNLGGMFTIAFLIVQLWRTKGDVRRVLLGRHAADPA